MARAREGGREGERLARLQSLAATPRDQAAYAARLVETETHPQVFQAALDALAAHGDPAARPALLARYAACTEEGARRDRGCYLRAAMLGALRHLALPEDRALLEAAVATYEFMPPGPVEVAAALRGAALITLNDIDGVLATYHAVRLLTDRHTSHMSGEPAVTAAQVLAAQGQEPCLYAYLLRDAPGLSDVTAECLRNLTALPAALLGGLVDRYGDSRDEIVLLGLFDLLLAHEDGAAYHDFVLAFLAETRLYNIYRYLVSTIIAGRHADLIAALRAMARDEEDRRKVEILEEALALR